VQESKGYVRYAAVAGQYHKLYPIANVKSNAQGCIFVVDGSVVAGTASAARSLVVFVEAVGGVAVVGEAGFSVTVAGISALPLGLVPRALVRTPKVSPSRAVNRLLLRVSNSSAALPPLCSRTRRKASIRSSGVARCMR
jgi:hypothetical protein